MTVSGGDSYVYYTKYVKKKKAFLQLSAKNLFHPATAAQNSSSILPLPAPLPLRHPRQLLQQILRSHLKIAAILKKFSIVKGSQLFSILLNVMRDIPNSFAISSCLMPRAVRYEPISTPNSKSSSEKSSSPTSCA